MATEGDQLIQNIFKRVSRPLPNLLFHYTTIEGLLGIIKSKSLWASQIQYLNDSLEFNVAIDIARKNFEDLSWIPNSQNYKFLLAEMASYLRFAADLPICVCSFSEQGDLLNQWRAYSPTGSGFSIGFKPETIILSASKHDFYGPIPCVYDSTTQDQIVKDIINHALRAFDKAGLRGNALIPFTEEERKRISEINIEFVSNLSTCAPLLKHYSFEEEEEWRLISPPINSSDPNYKHRKGFSLIVPYYELDLQDENGKLNISRIIIGPTPHTHLSRNSVISFLYSNNVSECPVENSSTPYRNW